MKKIYLLIGFSALLSGINAQCTESQEEKILLVGDSWAFFMNFDGTINTVSKDWGHSDVKYYTNLTLSENGAETDDFLLPSKITELNHKLNTMPNLEVVHLSIGGNDFLGNWNKNFTQVKTDSLANAVIGRLDSIVDIIHTARPDVHIFWSGYVYTNFGEVIGAITPILQSVHPFYGTWQSMGFPTFSQLNAIQNWFQLKIKNHYATDSKFTYIHAPGLMQYEFGQTAALEVSPFGTYAPYTVALPEGDVNYPSPKNTMRDYALTKDCFHLSAAGYLAFISYHFQKFYHKYLMDDAYTIASFNTSGSISSTGGSSNELIVGKTGSVEQVGIINLDNTHLEPHLTDNLELFFKIESLSGTNMLNNGLLTAEIVTGNFGPTSNLEADDFSVSASASAIPCIFGNKEVGKWVRLELPVEFNQFVNQSNAQIRLKYSGTTDALLKIVNTTDGDFQPVLNIKYGESTAGIDNLTATSNLSLFPNPAKNTINITSNYEINEVTIYSLAGENVIQLIKPMEAIDISNLNSGMYLITVQYNGLSETIKFVKH